ncbi:MAG TPA: DinB family protein [Terriglobia bacterium]|nr:DinB family protein [Terriglobia bacterium]
MSDQSTRPLVELLRGEGAHIDPVACVADLAPEQAGILVAGSPHTIWQLLSHLNFWMEYDLGRVRGEVRPHPVHNAESFPPAPAPGDAGEWRQAVARFEALIDEHVTLAGSPAEMLAREVPPAHVSHTRRASTVLAVLWQTVAHNSYHIGQIALLRRSLGAWPPPGGGNTW